MKNQNKIGSMRKSLFFALIAILFTACTSDIAELYAPIQKGVLYTSFDEDTRILLNEELKTVWTEGDEVSVFYKSYINECWKFTGKTGDTSGQLVRQGNANPEVAQTVVAVYPYNQEHSLMTSKLLFTIANKQNYAVDSYGLGDNMMLAVSENDHLAFKNLFGYLRISFTGTKTIDRITVSTNGGEAIAGNAMANISTLELSLTTNTSNSIMLDCGQGVKLSSTPTTFHIALMPQAYESGITIVAHCTDGTQITKSTNKCVNIVRNHILPMASLNGDNLAISPAKQALIDLYNSTNGDKWTNKTNWCTSNPISTWYGVSCDSKGNVISLDLSGNNLAGTIPESLATLMDSCKVLDIGFNDLSGTVPQSVLNHSNWQYLWGDILSSTLLDYNLEDIPFPTFTMYDTNFEVITSESVWKDKKVVIFYGWNENCLNILLNEIYNIYQTYKNSGLEVIGWTTEYFYTHYQLSGGYGAFPWKTYPQLVNVASNSIRPGVGYYPTAYLPAVAIFNDKKQLIYSSCFSTRINISDMQDAVDKAMVSTDYVSSDYSKDGEVKLLQKASAGNGIDIVLMGDGYSDRLIADGTYDSVMNSAMEAFFSEEPYKSHRNLFNVYSVTAVSPNEAFVNGCSTALDGFFGEGTYVGGDDSAAMSYALNAVGTNARLNNSTIIVMMNSPAYAGTCYMYYPNGLSSGNTYNNDHGQGLSISYFPIGVDNQALTRVLAHEACGHGFAKLADEYSYYEYGQVPYSEVRSAMMLQEFGWYRNIDFINDPQTVLWSHFLADTRYQYDGLGVFEGGMTYWTGVWRPTDNSIMRHNTDGFNAPSRERIYYRINKLAYGTSWQYDYEEFVKFDAVSRKTSRTATQTAAPMIMNPEEHTPPVIRPYSCSEVLMRK